jgi:hypothetical protein
MRTDIAKLSGAFLTLRYRSVEKRNCLLSLAMHEIRTRRAKRNFEKGAHRKPVHIFPTLFLADEKIA